MFLIIEFSFKVFGCHKKAQQISEHCIFQKCLRSNKSLKIQKMVPKPKKSPKLVELCLKLFKFLVFTQKIQKQIGFGSSEKFRMELANVIKLSMFLQHCEIKEIHIFSIRKDVKQISSE